DEQVEVSRNNIEKTEVELQALQKKTDVNIKQSEGPLAKVLIMKEKLAEFETQIQIRSSNINALNSQLDSIQRRLTGSSSYAANESTEEKQIKLQIEQLTSQKAVLYEKLGSDAVENPEVQRIDRQIADLRSQYYTLLSSVKTGSDNTVSGDMSQVWKTIWDKKNTEEIELFLLKGQARLFSGLITNFERKNPNLLQDAIDISRLLRLKQVYEERLSSLIKQKESLSIQYYGSTGSLKIIDPAKEPVAIYNKVFTNIFVGTVLGLIIGIAIAVGLEFMDNRIKSIAAISSVTSIAVVGRIPPINVGDEDNAVEGLRKKINKIKTKDEEEDKNEIRRKAMISQFNPRSFVSERYRSLRTNIQFANIDSPIRSLLVASAGPGEGKTTTAVNLAISFADMGHRVCIVDTDLRKAKHHMLFDIQEQPGLTDIILGQTDLDTALQKTSINNLHSLTVGRDAKDHSEIFSSLRMNFMMNELEKKFDIV
ncbi:MAG TPA: polysaccharide biosynthesis tyrosine autokinase, partial [bacterium]|nr:polysaccharide biosynthesis tyrosine autokinase [bacterium]